MQAVHLTCLALALAVATVAGNICKGRSNGVQLPDTSDCSSYFVCDYGTPSLFHCGGGLLYDDKLGVCNWAHSVKCGQTLPSIPTEEKPPRPHSPQTPQIPHKQPTAPINTFPQFPVHTPVDAGDDFYPGIKATNNSPLGYQCTIDGFYFAPHPDFCEQYFICENRRIHFHQCGAGIHWDYIYLQCDFPERAYCYSNNTQSNNNPPAYLPVSGSPPTYIGVTAPVAIEFPIQPVFPVAPAVPEEPAIQEPQEEIIVCPEDTPFMAHSDCHRYHICIAGLAIPISCPDTMAWDDSTRQCTEEALLTCEY